jgi:CBS domain-containing protein
MVEHGVRHLPVVDSLGRLVGVITNDDLRAAFIGAAFASPDASAARAAPPPGRRVDDVRAAHGAG